MNVNKNIIFMSFVGRLETGENLEENKKSLLNITQKVFDVVVGSAYQYVFIVYFDPHISIFIVYLCLHISMYQSFVYFDLHISMYLLFAGICISVCINRLL